MFLNVRGLTTKLGKQQTALHACCSRRMTSGDSSKWRLASATKLYDSPQNFSFVASFWQTGGGFAQELTSATYQVTFASICCVLLRRAIGKCVFMCALQTRMIVIKSILDVRRLHKWAVGVAALLFRAYCHGGLFLIRLWSPWTWSPWLPMKMYLSSGNHELTWYEIFRRHLQLQSAAGCLSDVWRFSIPIQSFSGLARNNSSGSAREQKLPIVNLTFNLHNCWDFNYQFVENIPHFRH